MSGLIFLLFTLPFFLNDLLFIALDGSYRVYVADYISRLVLLVLLDTGRQGRWPPLQPPDGPKPHYIFALLAVVLLPLIHPAAEALAKAIDGVAGVEPLFSFPEIRQPFYLWVDLTFGLLLVAISEELVFRRLARHWLEAIGCTTAWTVGVSAVIFGFMHWGGGAGQVVTAALIGALYMWVYIRLNRLWPLVVAHWAHNFFIFGPFELF
ncbi:MAG: CPBP family intramembrane glutamic endopeptidase [Minwuia sp.]|uniref:CPBP family intramembrane glutamic endopeptidase n=1 Tax=Minwuia sp. TaxID=2493630 RepID=UPI003A85AF6E